MFGNISLKALLAAGAVALVTGGASAATTLVSCNTAEGDVTGYVMPTSSCFGLLDLSDGEGAKLADLNGLTINGTEGGWSTLGKFENTGSNTYFSLDDELVMDQAGNWSLTALAKATYGEFMLIFKAGQARNTLPAEFVGYILAGDFGTWSSPFLKANSEEGAEQRDLSNVELYGRGTPAPIPLPAAGFMLIGALGGLAALRRRCRAV